MRNARRYDRPLVSVGKSGGPLTRRHTRNQPARVQAPAFANRIARQGRLLRYLRLLRTAKRCANALLQRYIDCMLHPECDANARRARRRKRATPSRRLVATAATDRAASTPTVSSTPRPARMVCAASASTSGRRRRIVAHDASRERRFARRASAPGVHRLEPTTALACGH